jgi:putative inorganic carbon (hco3(-)) transporter
VTTAPGIGWGRALAGVTAFAALAILGAAAVHVALDRPLVTSAALAVIGLGVVVVLATLELSTIFSLALVAAVFSGHTELLPVPVPPDRIIFAVGLGKLAWLAWLAPRQPGDPDEVPPHPGFGLTHWLIIVVSAYALVSTAWAIDDQTRSSIFELVDRLGLYPFLAFVIAPVVFATERARRHLAVALTCLGAYLGVTAVFEVIGPQALVFPRYIVDPTVGLAFGRARGPFVEAGTNGLAIFAAGVSALLLLWTVRPLSRGVRVLLAGVAALCTIGILLTLTRQVWLGTGLALIVVALTSARGRRLLVPAVAAIAILVGGAYLFAPGVKAKVTERAGDKTPVWDRLNLSNAAIRMFEEKPMLGWGWNGFRTNSRDFFRQADDYPMTTPGTGVHNVFLANLVDLGMVGTALWAFALVAGVGGALWRIPPPELLPWRTALLALAVAWLTVANLSPLNTSFPNTILWLWAGIVWRPRRAPEPVPVREREPEDPRPAPEPVGAGVSA